MPSFVSAINTSVVLKFVIVTLRLFTGEPSLYVTKPDIMKIDSLISTMPSLTRTPNIGCASGSLNFTLDRFKLHIPGSMALKEIVVRSPGVVTP